ncbi:hypothetical protein [Hoylesella shahii]|uniref:hypothetical protein n=1 Tax=Hoylesella shahii TaxID=228603 RepID=UPI0028E4FA06|nr:hypothetical protein [Hoylesella shahii]
MMRSDLDRLCVEGVNYSVQPNNEIWYTTIDNNKVDAAAVLTNYGGDSATRILAHVFENGLWKVKADRPIQRIPENYIRYAPTIVSISLPKLVFHLGAWSMGFARRLKESPNLRTIIFNGQTPTSFNSSYLPMTAGNIDIYVPRGERNTFMSCGILAQNTTNRVLEWGEEEVEISDPTARQVLRERLGRLSLNTIRAVEIMPNGDKRPLGKLFVGSTELKSFEEIKYFTSLKLLDRDFYNCPNLGGVMTIPASVMTIIGASFFNTRLIGIEFLAQSFKWGHGAIWRCKELKWVKMHSVEVPQKKTANDQYRFDFAITNDNWKLYVPDESVEKYRADHNFQNLDDRIRPMSEFKG